MTKTIQNTNFVQFMHEVVDAVASGYTLDYEPANAPESTPSYKVTLVEKPFVEYATDFENVKVPNDTTVAAINTIESGQVEHFDSADSLMKDLEDSPAPVEQLAASKPQAGRPPRGARK